MPYASKEKQALHMKQYYLKNREKNREKVNLRNAKWKSENKEYIELYNKTWRLENKDRIAVARAKWVKRNKDKVRFSCKKDQSKDRINLNESYLRRMIVESSNLSSFAIDENMIMLKRVEISCNRFVKNGSTKIPLKRHV